jgi:hypothetical protein
MEEFGKFAPEIAKEARDAIPLDEDAILLEDSQKLMQLGENWDEVTLAYWRFSRHPANLIAPRNFIDRASMVIHGQPLQARLCNRNVGQTPELVSLGENGLMALSIRNGIKRWAKRTYGGLRGRGAAKWNGSRSRGPF